MKELSQRQQQITEAALQIISSHGIQNLTIKTLSEKIGVTEGAIYRHFTSKAEILGAIADLFKTSSTAALNALLEENATGLDKLKTFFLERCKQFYHNPGLTVVMFSENIFKSGTGMEKKTHETIQSHQQLLLQSIRQSQQEGVMVNEVEPQHLFMMVIGAMRLLVTRWRGSNFSFNLESEGQKLWVSIEKLITNR